MTTEPRVYVRFKNFLNDLEAKAPNRKMAQQLFSNECRNKDLPIPQLDEVYTDDDLLCECGKRVLIHNQAGTCNICTVKKFKAQELKREG